MSAWKLPLMLTAIVATLATSGCSVLPSLFEKPVYVRPGAMVEVAQAHTFEGWITNAKTGARERRLCKAEAGYMVVRPRIEEFGLAPVPKPLTAPELDHAQ